jgi:hypothetical protein
MEPQLVQTHASFGTRNQHSIPGLTISCTVSRCIGVQVCLIDDDHDWQMIGFGHSGKSVDQEGIPVGLARGTDHHDLVDVRRYHARTTRFPWASSTKYRRAFFQTFDGCRVIVVDSEIHSIAD